MIAGAKTIAATPSLRRCAEIGRPLFAAVSAMLAVILCPVASIWAVVRRLPLNFCVQEILRLEEAGLTMKFSEDRICEKKDEYCDQRATGATAGITESKGARP